MPSGVLCVTDKGLGSFQSSFAPLLGDVKAGSLLLALLLSCTWVCLYSFRTMWYQKHQQLQGRTWRHSTKKFELSKLPRSAWLWKNTPCSKQYRELYWGVLSAEHQKWARVSCLSYWGSVGSVMFQFRANSSSVWSYWKCQGFPQSGFCFLSDYWRQKLEQALPGILQGKPKHKVIFRSNFLTCLLKNLSLLCIRMNLAIRSLYK